MIFFWAPAAVMKAPLGQTAGQTARRLATWRFAASFAVRSRVAGRDPERQRALGRWTREQLVEMGPTFVKVGQLLGTREDVFDPAFVMELELLQDEVPPMSSEDLQLALSEAGVDFGEFEAFDTQAHKAASLGQVHRARLHGQDVCVKVQRRGIADALSTDTRNIQEVLWFLNAVGLETGPSSQALFDESSRLIEQELDYTREARSAERAYRFFEGVNWVRVPRPIARLSNRRVLTMEWVPGMKVTDTAALERAGVSKPLVAQALVQFFVRQVASGGFFHADLHPGNLAVSVDGRLAVYDFGITVDLQPELRETLMEVAGFALRGDTRGAVELLTEAGIVVPNSRDGLEDVIEFLESAMEKLQGSKGTLDQDLVRQLAREKPFLLPVEFVFLGRNVVLLDGICRRLVPSFSMYQALMPAIEAQLGGAVREAFDVRELASSTIQMPSKIDRIASAVSTLQRRERRAARQYEQGRRALVAAVMLTPLLYTTPHPDPLNLFAILAAAIFAALKL